MDNELKITIPQGTLQGTYYKSVLNEYIYSAFLGIPYAEPPIKDLRFKAPVPLESWSGILNAKVEKDDCIHYSYLTNAIVGSEDCLYLNVFTPEPPKKIKQLKPVIAYIHYGGNYWGSGSTKGFGAPDFIVHHDVVFVSMNYRLHVLGFLNLNLPECAGNMGSKDQVLALKWIQRNIKYFGGDPNNVTLYGNSSGATAVHFHMSSPMSKGLFHKAIMQNGYCLSPSWCIMEDPMGTAFEYGRILRFKGDTNEQLYKFLKQKSINELVFALRPLKAALNTKILVRSTFTPFINSIEIFEEGAFLTQSPLELQYQTVAIPMICSVCEVEGTDLLGHNKTDLEQIIAKHLWLYKLDDETLKYITEKVRLFYFGSETNYNRPHDKLLDLYSDLFTCKWQDMVDFQSKRADVFVYRFMFEGELNYQKNLYFPQYRDKIKGTFHGDDCSYFIFSKYGTHTFGRQEKTVITNICNIFTNFAKYGKPNHPRINWRPHTPDNPCFLQFNVKLKVVDGIINERRATFWKKLMEHIEKKIQ